MKGENMARRRRNPPFPGWIKAPLGWFTKDGVWHLRKITFSAKGIVMWWLYGPAPAHHGRYCSTGSYEDAVHFFSLKEAKRFVESEFYD